MNFDAMRSSSQSTAPFSVVPSVMAFLCTVTNWRFSLCSSDIVIFRGGRLIFALSVGVMDSCIGPPYEPAADCSAMIVETMDRVVFSRLSNASVGALLTYIETFQRWLLLDGDSHRPKASPSLAV